MVAAVDPSILKPSAIVLHGLQTDGIVNMPHMWTCHTKNILIEKVASPDAKLVAKHVDIVDLYGYQTRIT